MKKILPFIFISIFLSFYSFADNISIIVKPDVIFNGSVVVLNFVNLDDDNIYFVEVDSLKKRKYYINEIKEYTTVLIGISLNAPEKVLVSLYENNKIILTHSLNIKRRFQQKSYLKVKNKYATKKISKELKKRLIKEHNIISAKKNEIFNDRYFYGNPFFPLKNHIISSPFGAIRIFNKKRKSVHYGVDIPSDIGSKIHSVFDGKVTLVGNFYYSGNTVLINSGQGLVMLYAHLNKIYVKENEFVRKGDIIGEVGATGRVTGPHLHLGAYIHNVCIDPISLFDILKVSDDN